MNRDQKWWLAATATAAGDIVTTGIGIGMLGQTEQNPVPAQIFDLIGLWPGMIAGKAGGMILMYLLTIAFIRVGLMEERHSTVTPMVITAIWGLVAVLNTIHLLFVI